MTESKNAPNFVTRFVRRATSPSTMSKMPANTMTSPAHRNIPLANKTIAKMLMTMPMSVRTLGWIRKLDSPITRESTMRFPPAPIRPLMEVGCCVRLFCIVHRGEADDFESAGSRRNLYFHGLAFTLVQEASSNRGRCRYQPRVGICVFACHKLVGDFLVLVHIQHHYLRSQGDTVSRNLVEVDHRQVRHPLLELTQADPDEILTLARGLIIGILAEVTQGGRRFEGPRQFFPQFLFEGLNFFFKLFLNVATHEIRPKTI